MDRLGKQIAYQNNINNNNIITIIIVYGEVLALSRDSHGIV